MSYYTSRCAVIVTVPDGHIMAVKPVRLQGLCVNVYVYVVSEYKHIYGKEKLFRERIYLGCSAHINGGKTPAREYIYVPLYARLRIVVTYNRRTRLPFPLPTFSVEIHFSSLPGSTDLLDVDFTTPLNGKL